MACPGDVEVRASAGSTRVHGPLLQAAPPAAAPLSLRQCELQGPRIYQNSHRGQSFSHFHLLHQWDCYASSESTAWPPFFLRRRSAVTEVLAAPSHRLVISLADSGVCTAFDQDSGQQLCFLNLEADEVVRSLFLTDRASPPSLITVSVFSGDSFKGLKVRSTPLSEIRAGRPHVWRPLFTSEAMYWPGFVEFDDYSSLAVTCCANTRLFKVWDLRAPFQPRFHVDSSGVVDFKVANSALVLTMDESDVAGQQLRILDLEHGICLKELCLQTVAGHDLECMQLVELFGRHLITKAVGGPLRITDVVDGSIREVSDAQFPAPQAFIHLPFNHAFLAFWEGHEAQLWSLKGERLATLEGVVLCMAAGTNIIWVSETQDLMFVFCKPGSSTPGDQHRVLPAADKATQQHGCIRVSCLLTGRQVAVLRHVPSAQHESRAGACKCRGAHAAAGDALAHITSLFYDQACHRLYTGTADGGVQAWGL